MHLAWPRHTITQLIVLAHKMFFRQWEDTEGGGRRFSVDFYAALLRDMGVALVIRLDPDECVGVGVSVPGYT